MNKLSNILGKPIISLYNGQVEGTIISTIFDKKLQKIKGFIIFSDNENEDLKEKLIVLTKDIFNIGTDAIIIKNNSYIYNASSYEPNLKESNPINCVVYTAQGTKIGTIKDVNIDEKFNVIDFELKDANTIDAKKVAVFGNDIIIIQDENKIIDISRFTIKKPKIEKTSETVQIQRIEPLILEEDSEKQNSTTLPLKLTATSDLLLGRVMTETLYTQSKEIIAKKGNIINSKIIDSARKYGKIKELYIFSV